MRASNKKPNGAVKNIAASYNRPKEYKGRQYTGMAIGRTHNWYYDKASWKEKKITPDRWEFSYSTVKRRKGKAPEGSGVPVGTGYHWFILAHQYVEKLNANDYITQMAGLKFKLSHKRATKDRWSASINAQKNSLVKILKNLIAELEHEPEQVSPVLFDFSYKSKNYKGMGIPILASCANGICRELDITLNKKHVGIIRCVDGKWKIGEIKNQGLARAIGEQISSSYA